MPLERASEGRRRRPKGRPEAETYQASTLAAHVRHCLRDDDKVLWDEVTREYQRVTGKTSTIGLLGLLAAIGLMEMGRMGAPPVSRSTNGATESTLVEAEDGSL